MAHIQPQRILSQGCDIAAHLIAIHILLFVLTNRNLDCCWCALVIAHQELPVLTVSGDSFPSRVGASLLSSFGHIDCGADYDPNTKRSGSFDVLEKTLLVQSKKSLEDTALRLMAAPHTLDILRGKLGQARRGSVVAAISSNYSVQGRQPVMNGSNPVGFFNTNRLVNDFRRAMEVTGEVSAIRTRGAVPPQSPLTTSLPPRKMKRVSSAHPHILVGASTCK
jgi:hypothetical protein